MSDRVSEGHPRLAPSAIERCALMLREAHDRMEPVPPLRTQYPAARLSDAYAIQDCNTAHWLDAGRVAVGAKIGLTAKAVQKQLGVDQPDFGILFADMEVPDGGVVSPGRLIQPKVEGEIAFVLDATPDADRMTTAELLDCVAYALPALEIVDSRIARWDIGIFDTVADNASSGLFVLGTRPVPIEAIDLRLCGMVLEKNGEPASFGAGAACLDNPLHALRWLAGTMARIGRPLAAGDIVLSGALGPMVPVQAGDRIAMRINGIGDVQVRFAPETSEGAAHG
ncbi:2-keto-4-pentenoate hydratase [Rhizorhabdus histidinilytica]|uniref:2-keto-4-pentenoate hydratase n=1 Tax=Rhizorhabdus histidinilytica TaxID=439228 RepID=UPI00321FD216